MGGTIFPEIGYGTKVKDVFNKLTCEAEYESGYDPYNGTISTTTLGEYISGHSFPRLLEIFKEGHELTGDDYDYLEENESLLYPRKSNSNYTEVFSHYEVFTPQWTEEKIVSPRKKGVKTLKVFSVKEKRPNGNFITHSKQTLASGAKREAKKLAVEKGIDTLYIHQERSDGSFNSLGTITLVPDGVKKTAGTSKTKYYKKISKFVFFVYASC